MSSQSPSNSTISTDQAGPGINPAAAFGANEWLVDEIYQQYLQDPCIDGIAAYWFDMFLRLPEAIEPQVWCTRTVS
ncbi:hypothetical protein, partial [Streptomyces sp. NPDC002690]